MKPLRILTGRRTSVADTVQGLFPFDIDFARGHRPADVRVATWSDPLGSASDAITDTSAFAACL